MSRALRVVQWATGNVGSHSLREIIRHPELELVGVLTYNPAKEGTDAGELCGADPTGVLATTDRAAIVALRADCVLYMPSSIELDDVEALLSAGTNVITTRGELTKGDPRLGPEGWARVEKACEVGSASLYTTGSSPGFISDALPFALISLQRHVESVAINEYANMSQRDSPEMLFDLMGFGKPLEAFADGDASWMVHEFGVPLATLAASAGRHVDAWTNRAEVAAAKEDLTIAAGQIPAGTVAAFRNSLVGLSDGHEVVSFTANWFCTTDLDPAWELLATGWRVHVKGDAPMDVDIEFPVGLEEYATVMPGLTGNRPVNAIPYVVEAPAGVLTTADLPPIVPAGPVGSR
jgi:4-hydroxy-tetrahydrodipicolinate reductase